MDQHYFQHLESRLAKCVADKLGVAATVRRWDDCPKTGAKIPVFAVPQDALVAARAAGLTCEAR